MAVINWGQTTFGRSNGGGVAPGNWSDNSFTTPFRPPNTYQDANGRVQYDVPHKPPAPPPDPMAEAFKQFASAFAPQKPNVDMQNNILKLLQGQFSGLGKRGPALDEIQEHIGPQSRTNMPWGGGGGGGGATALQEFMPDWLTNQTINDIHAKGAVRGNPFQTMNNLVGARGVDYGSPMFAAQAARKHAFAASDAARAGGDTAFGDQMERAKFDIRHALARTQDVTQGARNQALRDQIMTQGQGNQFNQVLQLLGQFA